MTLTRTPSQTVGPFFSIGVCRRSENHLVEDGIELRGVLYDGAGDPIGDGVVEIWDAVGRRWGRCGTDAAGRFTFLVEKPAARDGHVPCLHAFVFARGLLRHQLTRIYFPDEPNENDAAFAALPDDAKTTVVAAPDNGGLRFDIRMQGERATVFFVH